MLLFYKLAVVMISGIYEVNTVRQASYVDSEGLAVAGLEYSSGNIIDGVLEWEFHTIVDMEHVGGCIRPKV